MLTVKNLSKSFAGVRALADVQLTVQRGEVHALMGENGAGKSTLMRILAGLETPDLGEIRLDGELLRLGSVREARQRGIAMIHQELLAVTELTVAQNIFLGREPRRWGLVDERQIRQQTADLLRQMNVDIPPDAPMKHLSVAQMQMVEIAKALVNDRHTGAARVLIMDEPTSALSDTEVATLFSLIRALQQQGVAIVYISHKMDEIFAIADTITVLRDGRYIDSRPATRYTPDALITQMVGRELGSLFAEHTPPTGREVLRVNGLTRPGAFHNVSFAVHAGEVVGLGGLMGAGRSEVVRALFGLDAYTQGTVFFNGEPVSIQTPQDAIRLGIGFVGEDRKATGFVPALSVQHNLTLASLPQFARRGLIDEQAESSAVQTMVRDLNIKTAGLNQPVVTLSGGNQQKVVIGKMLLASPTLVILDEPTRGIDVGAKAEIYKLINQLTDKGIAVLLVSSELPELLGLSDRIVVLAKGKQTAVLFKEEATQETVMQYAMAA